MNGRILTDNFQGNKALYKPCATWRGEFEEAVAVFLCNDGDGHRWVIGVLVTFDVVEASSSSFVFFRGEFVYIRDDREQQEYFGLCEVQVKIVIVVEVITDRDSR